MNRRLLAPLGLAALAWLASPATAADDERAPDRVLWLTGHGEVKAKPDMARVTLGVMSEGATAREALTANTQAMQKVMAALKSAGIAEKDIQTSNFAVSARYGDETEGRQQVIGYTVSNNLDTSVRELPKLGALLDDVVSQGSNQIYGIAFDIAERQPLEDEARKRAVADARRKAAVYAAAAGVKLGRVLALGETAGAPPPVPIVGRAMMKAEAAPVPVAEGEQTIAIDVSVAWEID
ncbi:MAG: SIMPL domain-containing protein [Hyphomicrobiales bacterium]